MLKYDCWDQSMVRKNIKWEIRESFHDAKGKLVNSKYISEEKNIPNIHPRNVNGIIISNFKKNAGLFNSHFASQCTPINNKSVLPPLEYKTNRRLASVNTKKKKKKDIYLILKNLDPENVHGWDNMSIRMIQLCGKAIAEPSQIFNF